MRFTTKLAIALSLVMGLAAAPAVAGTPHPDLLKLGPPIMHHPVPLCVAPALLESVCVSWGQAGAGQLFGPCLRYQLECVSPAHIQ